VLPANSTVQEVDDSVLNSGSVPHGAAVGIPYAPDSLPTAKDAGTPKVWSECDRPATGGRSGTDQKLFVLGGSDAAKISAPASAPSPQPGAGQPGGTGVVGGSGQVDDGHALYVEGPDGKLYLVDANGVAHQLLSGSQAGNSVQNAALDGYAALSPGLAPALAPGLTPAANRSSTPKSGASKGATPGKSGKPTGSNPPVRPVSSTSAPATTPSAPAANPGADPATAPAALQLASAAFGATVGMPQSVTKEWLDTVRAGDPISIPTADIPKLGDTAPNSPAGQQFKIGDLFRLAGDNGQFLHYVVLADGIHRVSDFTDRLLGAMHQSGTTEPLLNSTAAAGANLLPMFEDKRDWPQQAVSPVNSVTSGSSATVVCSVFTGATAGSGAPVLRLWTGPDYPIDSSSGSAGVYVTPGAGLLYRAVSGTSTTAGSVNLLTDTGLRYPVQLNTDSALAPSAGATAQAGGSAQTPAPGQSAGGQQQSDNAQARLGYASVTAAPVPQAWSQLLPAGPELDSTAAGQQQNS
jgi:hypothetical protein